MSVYPENTTLEESYLCSLCAFKDDKIACKRAWEIKSGCLIMIERNRNGI